MSRRLLVCAVALLVALPLLGAVAPAPSSARAARPSLTLEGLVQRVVVPRTDVYLSGELRSPGPQRRPVVVEQRRGSRWTPVARDRTIAVSSRYGVDLQAPARPGPVTWRVVAPAVRRDGRVWPRLVSRTRTLRVVVPRISWRLPGTAAVGTTVGVPVRITDPLPATSLRLEQLVNGRWTLAASASTRRTRTALRFVLVTSGPSRFRLRGPLGVVGAAQTLRGLPGAVLPTRRVSTTSNGSQTDGGVLDASASDDGRWVAFTSTASNAVPGDDNEVADVFLKDTTTGALRRVSEGPRGREADRRSWSAVVSGDGSTVAFVSLASTLVAGDTRGTRDVFVWSRATGRVTRVARDADTPSLSRDGRSVASVTAGAVVLLDRGTGTVAPVADDAREPVVSADGGSVAFTTAAGVSRWTRATGATVLVAPGATGPRLDADGSVVGYVAPATDGPQAFVRDLVAGTTTQVSTGAPDSPLQEDAAPTLDALSADGSVVLFSSAAPLVADDVDAEGCESEAECYSDVNGYDAYVWRAGEVTMASRSASGRASDWQAVGADLTADGSTALFSSRAVLVPGQTARGGYSSVHAYVEAFVRDLDPA